MWLCKEALECQVKKAGLCLGGRKLWDYLIFKMFEWSRRALWFYLLIGLLDTIDYDDLACDGPWSKLMYNLT